MTDIVERLRLDAEPTKGDMETAADEIERLRAALDRAADALHDTGAYEAWMQARVALDAINKEIEARTQNDLYDGDMTAARKAVIAAMVELTRLRAENKRMRDALSVIENLERPQHRGLPRRVSIREIALAALVYEEAKKK